MTAVLNVLKKNLKLIARKGNDFFCWGPWMFIIPSALAVVIAAGTIVESKYDANAAAKLVYRTWFMYLLLGQLCATLIAVMIDRWPWKKRHGPFLAAHIGILILLFGAWLTSEFGLDGTMRFAIGDKSRLVTVPNTDLTIWSSFDGDRYAKVFEKEVDFFSHSPKKKPVSLDLTEGTVSVVDYEPYVFPSRKITPSESDQAGAAIRFQMSNQNANINDWLVQGKKDQDISQVFGLAQVTLGKAPPHGMGGNELYITPLKKIKDGKEVLQVEYHLFYKDPKRKPLSGKLNEGEEFDTGWMGMKFHLLRYLPKAEDGFEFKVTDRPTPMSTSAIKIKYVKNNSGEGEQKIVEPAGEKKVIEKWVQLNDVLKIFTKDSVYIVTYGNRRIDIGFDLALKKFEVGHYQGTNRAMSYQSLVETPDKAETLISMNEPLKFKGLTFYQASFQNGPGGEPIASILSVNQDPGRWWKYMGSLILSIGVVWLFYNKRRSARAAAPKEGAFDL